MNKRIAKDQKSLKELAKKRVIVLFGTTGTGKSTLANAIIKGSDKIKVDEDGLYYVEDDLKKNGEVIFKIGHQVKSETKAPKFCLIHSSDKPLYLVDGPGINDNNLRNDYANHTAIKTVFKNSS